MRTVPLSRHHSNAKKKGESFDIISVLHAENAQSHHVEACGSAAEGLVFLHHLGTERHRATIRGMRLSDLSTTHEPYPKERYDNLDIYKNHLQTRHRYTHLDLCGTEQKLPMVGQEIAFLFVAIDVEMEFLSLITVDG
ncbi:hypothetical protein Tco_0024695 [Tanacetum coccineum]